MHRIVRDLQLQGGRASFVGTRRGSLGCTATSPTSPPAWGCWLPSKPAHLPSAMKIRLPQREDVWSMKERYCIDRGPQPSTVGPASDRHYHRLHGGSKHASHVCSEHEHLRTFRGKESIGASDLREPPGWVEHERSSSLGSYRVRSAILVLAISPADVIRETTSLTTKTPPTLRDEI